MYGTGKVNGHEFIRRARKLGHRTDNPVRFVEHRGKGSHATLYFGVRFTIVQDRRKDLRKGTFHAMCRQLGIDPEDL